MQAQGVNPTTSRSIRPSKWQARFNDYLYYSAQPNDSAKDSSTFALPQLRPLGMRYPIANYVSSEKFNASLKKFPVALTKIMEPKYFQEAGKDPLWTQAMADEIEALEWNKTWTVEDLPPGKKPISCKWGYYVKYNSCNAPKS